MKALLSALLFMMSVAFACDAAAGDRVLQSDEAPTFNDPNAEIVCPEGTEKRTAGVFYRDLDPDWDPNEPFPPPPGYVGAKTTKLPEIRVPRSFLIFPKAGYVSVLVVVDKTGAIGSSEVVCSTGKSFEKAALEALPSARFAPATLDGVPLSSVNILPFNFQVE